MSGLAGRCGSTAPRSRRYQSMNSLISFDRSVSLAAAATPKRAHFFRGTRARATKVFPVAGLGTGETVADSVGTGTDVATVMATSVATETVLVTLPAVPIQGYRVATQTNTNPRQAWTASAGVRDDASLRKVAVLPSYLPTSGVVTLATPNACPICEHPAAWSVDGELACSAHVGDVLTALYALTDGFMPAVVTPVGAR